MVDRRMSREHIPGAALHDPADLRERKSPLERNGRRHAGEHIADRGKLDDYNRAGCCHGKPCGGCGKTLSPKITRGRGHGKSNSGRYSPSGRTLSLAAARMAAGGWQTYGCGGWRLANLWLRRLIGRW